MVKKINRLEDYISAGDAACLLSKKLGRPIRPDYVRKLKNVRTHTVNIRSTLYNRDDLDRAIIKQKRKQEAKYD